MKGVCPDNTECENNQGGFNCNCAEGYEGDYCSDIDECNSTATCHESAECRNTDGNYTCSCMDGFYGNGVSCFPGQCLDRYCPKNQKCISQTTTGCKCKDGFQLNNVSVCEDIDDCKQTKCDDRAECINTIGSYTCQDIFSTTISTNTTFGFSSSTTEMSTHATLTTKRPLPRSFRWGVIVKTGFIFRHENVMKMSYTFWASPRESFCWLDETKFIVLSTDHVASKGHCELVDFVSLLHLFEN